MDEVLQVRAALQEWVAENHNNPDVPRIQKVINDLAFACSLVLVLIQNA